MKTTLIVSEPHAFDVGMILMVEGQMFHVTRVKNGGTTVEIKTNLNLWDKARIWVIVRWNDLKRWWRWEWNSFWYHQGLGASPVFYEFRRLMCRAGWKEVDKQ